MNVPQKIYGYLEYESTRCSFVLDGFIGRILVEKDFHFFRQKIESTDVLYGITTTNHGIAIHITSAEIVTNCIAFYADYFAISTSTLSDLTRFECLSFIGGTLNCILDPKLIFKRFNFQDIFDEKGYSIRFRPKKEFTKQYKLIVKDIPLTFESSITYFGSKGNKLGSVNSVINLKFEKMQDFYSISKWYIYVSKIVALLVQQQNIAFDFIKVSYKEESSEYVNAQIYYKPIYYDIAEKDCTQTISIRNFDKHFTLFSKLIETENFSINFLPNDNKNAKRVTYETVKNLCTAAEYEFSQSRVKKEKKPVIKNFVKEAKELLKNYKETTKELSQKTYESINSSLSYLEFPATEQFTYLYEANKNLINTLIERRNVKFSSESIQKFVKCRNEITHGNKPSLNKETADTAFGFYVLIYVSLLKRIGLSDDEILNALINF